MPKLTQRFANIYSTIMKEKIEHILFAFKAGGMSISETSQQINNLYKADVIKCDGDERKALLTNFINWYLNVFMRDKKLTKTKTPIGAIDIYLNSINSL